MLTNSSYPQRLTGVAPVSRLAKVGWTCHAHPSPPCTPSFTPENSPDLHQSHKVGWTCHAHPSPPCTPPFTPEDSTDLHQSHKSGVDLSRAPQSTLHPSFYPRRLTRFAPISQKWGGLVTRTPVHLAPLLLPPKTHHICTNLTTSKSGVDLSRAPQSTLPPAVTCTLPQYTLPLRYSAFHPPWDGKMRYQLSG